MIAVVDKAAKAVWGLGENYASSMQDAEREIAGKKRFNPALNVGELVYAQLKKEAPLAADGQELFNYCIFDAQQSQQQLGLF